MGKYLLTLVLIGLPFVAQAAYQPIPGGSYTFNISKPNGHRLCWDIAGGKAKNGSRVQLYTCKQWSKKYSSNTNQRWTYTKLGALIGYGGYCLDGSDKNGAPGARLMMRRCNGSKYQKWTLDYTGKDEGFQRPFLRFRSARGYCIGVDKGRFRSKTPLVLMSCKRTRFVTFNQRNSESAMAVKCAAKVRKLNHQLMDEIGGVNDYNAEEICDQKDNDVYKAFEYYVSVTLDHYRRTLLEKARRRLNR